MYNISQNASCNEVYVKVGEYNKQIFKVIKEAKINDNYIRMAITEEGFYNYFMDINKSFTIKD